MPEYLLLRTPHLTRSVVTPRRPFTGLTLVWLAVVVMLCFHGSIATSAFASGAAYPLL